MKSTALLTALLRKNAATQTQMNSMGEAETAGLAQSPTQNMFAQLMAKKNQPALPARPAAPAPALQKTLPRPAAPVVSPITPNVPTSPISGK